MKDYKLKPCFKKRWIKYSMISGFSLSAIAFFATVFRIMQPVFGEFLVVWFIFLAAIPLGLGYRQGLLRDKPKSEGKEFYKREWGKVHAGLYLFSLVNACFFAFFIFMWVDKGSYVVVAGPDLDELRNEVVRSVWNRSSYKFKEDSGNVVVKVYSSKSWISEHLTYYRHFKIGQFPKYFVGDEELDVNFLTGAKLVLFSEKKPACYYQRELLSDVYETLTKVASSLDDSTGLEFYAIGKYLLLDANAVAYPDVNAGICRVYQFSRDGVDMRDVEKINGMIGAHYTYPYVTHYASSIKYNNRYILLGWSELNNKFQGIVQ